jgi:AraC family transcriptional regulator, regulatory protein of adaptative response / methylated-DNA-[protein]-cysteine methyltransferase
LNFELRTQDFELLYRIARKNRSVRESDFGDDESMKSNIQFATVDQAVKAFDENQAWQQLCERDRGARFFYAVATTGVFCRPDCKSRRPLRGNVRFFASVMDAQNAGFRACKRCRPTAATSNPIGRIRAHIEANLDRSVPLAELGRIAGMSQFTAQRMFKQEMGVSPLQYQRSLRASRLRSALKQSGRVTDAIYEAGFGSSSRAYDGAQLGMTPARFAQGGKGESIGWCSAPSPFGRVIVGATERGLCWLSLAETAAEAETSLRAEFPAADLRRDPSLSRLVDAALQMVRDGSDLSRNRGLEGALDLRGTVFQLRVWQALRQIPRGETRSYSEVARELGEPNATRAVARACAMNRVALVVPCHRVVGASGSLTGYRWGVDRKRKLLEAERG